MPNINHAVLIAVPAHRVYAAITSSQGLSAWWTPNVLAEAKEGSLVRFPFGAQYYKEMRIIDLVPDKLVAWHCTAGADEWVGTDLNFKLNQTDRGTILRAHPELQGQLEQAAGEELTILRFCHNNWRGETLMYAECNYTWGSFMRSLKRYCETGNGTPWPLQHRG